VNGRFDYRGDRLYWAATGGAIGFGLRRHSRFAAGPAIETANGRPTGRLARPEPSAGIACRSPTDSDCESDGRVGGRAAMEPGN